ncbi:hypothetical protein ACLMJK_001070 [Lecanora helva]
MPEEHSGLQVAPRDPAAHAPEVDLSNESPEADGHLLSPSTNSDALSPSRPDFKRKDSQNALESDSRTWKSDNETLKETYESKEVGAGEKKPVVFDGPPTSHPRRRRLLPWIIGGVVLILALALGIGLGVGLTRHKSSKSTNATSISSTPLPHGIANDSSVAVVALGSGDKRLLYQENTGNIREALFSASTKQWTSNVNNIVATNAKGNTPLSALLVNSTGTPFAADTGPVVFLFYIAQNNVLASKQFISGAWTSRDNFSPTGTSNATFETAPDSRALAITSIANSTRSGEAFLFYVSQNGSAIALAITPNAAGDGIVASPGPALPKSLQGGHILSLASGITGSRPQVGVLTSRGTVYYELYFSFFTNNSWTEPGLQTVLVPPLPPNDQAVYPTSLTLANAYPPTYTPAAPIPTPTSTTAAYNETLLGDVNIAQVFVNNQKTDSYTLFGFWVNGTELAAYTTKNIGLSTQPQSPFPYTRLAGTTVGGGSDIYLYHQIDQTIFAEDMYNLDGGFFTTTNFSISTS